MYVGLGVGNGVGLPGKYVGVRVGAGVGLRVGADVGESDGADVGESDGNGSSVCPSNNDNSNISCSNISCRILVVVVDNNDNNG